MDTPEKQLLREAWSLLVSVSTGSQPTEKWHDNLEAWRKRWVSLAQPEPEVDLEDLGQEYDILALQQQYDGLVAYVEAIKNRLSTLEALAVNQAWHLGFSNTLGHNDTSWRKHF